MEAIHLGDPGWYLHLDNGLRFYVWRRAILKQKGKKVTDRVFSNIPSLGFSFPTGNAQESFGDRKRHATYGYFYDSWFHTQFHSDPVCFGDFLNHVFWPERRTPGGPMPLGFQTCVDFVAKKWITTRDVVDTEALLNAAAETGFWFGEEAYRGWSNNTEPMVRKYQRHQIWKAVVVDDPGAEEREHLLHNSMRHQNVALNNQPNIPIIPHTIKQPKIVQRRTTARYSQQRETPKKGYKHLRKLTPEESIALNEFFDSDAASRMDMVESCGHIAKEDTSMCSTNHSVASSDVTMSQALTLNKDNRLDYMLPNIIVIENKKLSEPSLRV
jgi:hypothetical protein